MGTDVVVVGGGISGMVAAHRLQRAGADVVLLEKEQRLGGIVETTIEDGFVVEGGPDSFLVAKGSVLELAAELGVDHEVISMNSESQGSYVWWDGRLHPLPGGLLLMVPSRLGPFLRSPLLSWRGKIRALKDLALPRSVPTGDESLGSFVRRRLGGEVLERIAEPLIAGIHAADPETMSLRASFPRFLEMEAEHRSLILAARRLDGRRVVSEGVSHFASFRLGMGQLTSALAAALDGVDIRTGVAVTSIERMSDRYSLRADDGSRLTASGLILAVPAPVASRLLRGMARDAADTIGGIGQVSNLAVTLAYPAEQLPRLNGSGFVVPSTQGSRIRGVSYLSRKWAGRVPNDGIALVRVFFASGQYEANPIETARSGLETMIGITHDPVVTWVRHHRHGLHRYTVGHVERMARVERALQAIRGVALAGAGFYGVGLNECIRSGWNAAQDVMGLADARSGVL